MKVISVMVMLYAVVLYKDIVVGQVEIISKSVIIANSILSYVLYVVLI